MTFYKLLPTTSVGNEWRQQMRIQRNVISYWQSEIALTFLTQLFTQKILRNRPS